MDPSNHRSGSNSRRYLPAVHAVPSHTALLHGGKTGTEADEREGSQFGFCFVTKVFGHLVWETGAGRASAGLSAHGRDTEWHRSLLDISATLC